MPAVYPLQVKRADGVGVRDRASSQVTLREVVHVVRMVGAESRDRSQNELNRRGNNWIPSRPTESSNRRISPRCSDNAEVFHDSADVCQTCRRYKLDFVIDPATLQMVLGMLTGWGSIAGADFFTTEVWTWQGLVTYYTVFVIDLASRRVQILGSTPHPEALFMRQVVRTLTMAETGVVSLPQVLICDRDRKWSHDVRRRLRDAGIRVVQIPERAPNAKDYASYCTAFV